MEGHFRLHAYTQPLQAPPLTGGREVRGRVAIHSALREQNLNQPPEGRQSLLWGKDSRVPEEWPLGTG